MTRPPDPRRDLEERRNERIRRVRKMVKQMDDEGFGSCSNHYECEAACPKEISVQLIAQMNRDYLAASVKGDGRP